MVDLSPPRVGDRVIINVGWPRHPVVGLWAGHDRRGRTVVLHSGRFYRRRGRRVWMTRR
jgi:hypothetical protein